MHFFQVNQLNSTPTLQSTEVVGTLWGAGFCLFKGLFLFKLNFIYSMVTWEIIGDTLILTGVGAIGGLMFTFLAKQLGKFLMHLGKKAWKLIK